MKKKESYTSRCPKCDGKMESRSTRFSKKYQVVVRTRKCRGCEYTVYTAEVDLDEHKRQEDLIRALESAISMYLQDDDIQGKNDTPV